MLRKLGGILLGAIVGYVIVSAIEMINLVLFKPPGGLDFKDPGAMAKYIESLPESAFILVVVASLVGAFAGVVIATRVARWRVAGLIVGMLMIGATVSNFFRFPHPIWAIVAAVAGLLAVIWAGVQVGQRTTQKVPVPA
jgi:hypothetical protein